MRRTLLVFGLFGVLVYCIYGYYLGYQHGVFEALIKQAVADNSLALYWDATSRWNRINAQHAHGIGFSILVLLAGLMWNEVWFSEKIKRYLGFALIGGCVSANLAIAVYYIPVMILGEVILLICLGATLVGIVKRSVNKFE
ncbi:hypothetical protein H1S01_06955 [Heliobacterium chlorum]|uniref:Uncharacterized protein n=1 Tax=Heliobacterium chlorum TaxID=2698 RepID=A0ABR7T0C2_HELCL|nr:hypothetical protein [Heliobacterium chlorum]MBC9784248.1 hypothetical protein [Heliobacterium chlorum]